MQTRTLAALTFALASGLCFVGSALAETIVIDDQVQVRDSSVDRPKRGSTMTQVEAKFGAPTTKHDAVGSPPITRWDYAGFSVFFEHDRVIDAVATSG
jgi:outer membrane protein assembly factor BamE (lipoprotein component of BamABCDE complex)